jgi:hypothetical protein
VRTADSDPLLTSAAASMFGIAPALEIAVELIFEVDGTSIKFSRNWLTGRCSLNTGTEDEILQSPWNPLTHFSLERKRRWQCSVKGHDVVIEKSRPALFAGVRPQTYRIFVDGKLVQEQSGF